MPVRQTTAATVSDSGQERNGDAPGTGVSPQSERRPDGSRPHLVGAVPGDEG